jgi:hypothetical protein
MGITNIWSTTMAEPEPDSEDGIKPRHDAESDGSLERSYTADGGLYVYRDGDDHVVVSNGRDASDTWIHRVPAERTHVAPGEQLWSIPNNWEQTYRISGVEHRAWHVYHIPETGVAVKVSIPRNTHLVDAWYRVSAVGESVVEHTGEIDREAARQTLKRADESGDFDDRVLNGLRELVGSDGRWQTFVRAFEESVREFGPEALNRGRIDVPRVTVDGSGPWEDTYRIDDLVYDAIGVVVDNDWDIVRDIERLLHERAVPVYPRVTVSIDTNDVEADYHHQALIQAGCSPAEAIDWYYVEHVGLSQTEWAAERNCDQSTVSGNVRQAHWTLDA